MKDAEFNRLVVSATELFLTVYQNSSEYIDNSAEPLIMERNGRSPEYSYWTDLAKSIYTEELYENALEHGSAYDCVLGLMINHEGKAYFLKNTPLSFGTYYEDDEYIFYFFKETIKLISLFIIYPGPHGQNSRKHRKIRQKEYMS